MLDLPELLGTEARRLRPGDAPPFSELRTRQRRRRAVHVVVIGGALSALVGAAVLSSSAGGKTARLDAPANSGNTSLEPRPYRTLPKPPNNVVEAGMVKTRQEGSEVISVPWKLLGVSEDGTAVFVQTDLDIGCASTRSAVVQSDSSSITISFLRGTGPSAAVCYPVVPLRIDLSEPLADRELRHASVDPEPTP